MEAKSDLLQECKIKFVHTFQVCLPIRAKILHYGNYIYFCFPDFMRILVASAICELSINSAIFSSDICQYCCFLLGQYSMLFEKFTCFWTGAENKVLKSFTQIHITNNTFLLYNLAIIIVFTVNETFQEISQYLMHNQHTCRQFIIYSFPNIVLFIGIA